MYLATLKHQSELQYQLRQSYQAEDGDFAFRTVFDLGADPRRFITPFADHIVLFHDDLLEAVSSRYRGDGEALLETLLWDFLPRPIQFRLEKFRSRVELRSGKKYGPLTPEERRAITRQVHIFDRRRLYYLRYGAVDQSRLSRLHEKCCRPLLGQSRDEREYYFAAEEKVLDPGKYLQYVYAIFNLQQYFSQSFAPWLPESLAMDEMAEHFEQSICRLNRDLSFWQHQGPTPFLHRHLTRYLIMFFDYRPRPRSFFEEYARSFISGHRAFRWPEIKVPHPPEEIGRIFATPYDRLKKMSKKQLNRLYRKKALELHPDRGGDHDQFIELSTVYEELLLTKKE